MTRIVARLFSLAGLTRSLVGRFISLTSYRWAVWNWAWTLCFLWLAAAGTH